MSTTTIEIPSRGMTEKPPWGAFIVLANKRHENRVESVAHKARVWIGNNIRPHRRIAITASKTWDDADVLAAKTSFWETTQGDKPNITALNAVRMLRARIAGHIREQERPLEAWFQFTAERSAC